MKIYSEKYFFKYFIYSWISAYVAFLFKDAVYYIFIFLPIYQYLLSENRRDIWKVVKMNSLLLVPIFSFGFYRILSMFGKNIAITTSENTGISWLRFLFNSIFYPFISFSQTFIPPKFMFKISETFIKFNYPNLIPYISNISILSENIISDFIFISFTFIFLIIIIATYLLNKNQRKNIIICILLYVISFIPVNIYLFPRGSSYIESRYVYFSVIFVGFIVAIILDTLRKISSKYLYIVTIIIFMFSGLYFYKQIVLIRRDVNYKVVDGKETKNVLNEFSRVLPILPEKSVIYLTGNTNYFGYINHPVPLQLNPGYILMVWYYKTGAVPKELLDSKLGLSVYGSQWYYEFGNKGFGYYVNKETLIKDLNAKKFEINQIIALYYDGSSKKLMNKTDEVIGYLDNNNSIE